MSRVTNMILSTPLYFGDDVERIKNEINSFFKDGEKGFVNMDDESLPSGWYGGSKFLEAELWVGAFNYLDLDELIKHLRSIKWDKEDYEKIQVIVNEQEDDGFRIIDIEL